MKRPVFALVALGALLAGSLATVPVTAMTPKHAGLTVLHVTLRPQLLAA